MSPQRIWPGKGLGVWPALRGSFTGLDPKDPSQWPLWPRALLCLVVCLVVLLALWGAFLSGFDEALLAEQAREAPLRQALRQKLRQVANHAESEQQGQQLAAHIQQLQQQLPRKGELEALLDEINQAGVRRGLQFELFRPGPEVFKDHLVEWPLALRVAGSYHDIAGFAADLARLSSIVTLHPLSLSPVKDRPGWLQLDCTARLFRQRDADERAAQQRALEKQP